MAKTLYIKPSHPDGFFINCNLTRLNIASLLNNWCKKSFFSFNM